MNKILASAILILATVGCTELRVVSHSTSAAPIAAPAGNYVLDGKHFALLFEVGHLGYSQFLMRFNEAEAQVQFDPKNVVNSQVTATIPVVSLDTNVEVLDKKVLDEVLEAEEFPNIQFKSTKLVATSDNKGQLTGDLTIRDVTRSVTLDVTFNGTAPNPLTRKPTIGISATGVFSRTSFGLINYLPAVGDEVKVRIEAEFYKRD